MPESQTRVTERVGKNEQAIAGLAQSFSDFMGEVRQGIRALHSEIKEIRDDTSRRQRTPWSNIISAVGVMLVIGGAILTAAMAPLYIHLQYQHELAKASEAQLASQVQVTTSMLEKFREIETQFYWAGDADAGERADNERLMRMLWKHVYGEDLPAKSPYIRGPLRVTSGR